MIDLSAMCDLVGNAGTIVVVGIVYRHTVFDIESARNGLYFSPEILN